MFKNCSEFLDSSWSTDRGKNAIHLLFMKFFFQSFCCFQSERIMGPLASISKINASTFQSFFDRLQAYFKNRTTNHVVRIWSNTINFRFLNKKKCSLKTLFKLAMQPMIFFRNPIDLLELVLEKKFGKKHHS